MGKIFLTWLTHQAVFIALKTCFYFNKFSHYLPYNFCHNTKMFRLAVRSAAGALQKNYSNIIRGSGARSMSGAKAEETDAEFDARYEAYFNRPDIDGWEYRKAMGDLAGMDLIPEPAIVNAALRATRRINDIALAVRTLEMVKGKCLPNEKEVWPYMLQEIQPTLDELGIPTPEDMGYDKPELALPNPY